MCQTLVQVICMGGGKVNRTPSDIDNAVKHDDVRRQLSGNGSQ